MFLACSIAAVDEGLTADRLADDQADQIAEVKSSSDEEKK